MFGQMGQLMGLMGKLPKIKEEFEKLQQKLPQLIAEGQAGGGMVTVRANGKFAILSCSISDEALVTKDVEMLEDLIVAATNQALEKAKEMAADEARKAAADLGLPPGLNIPGLS